MNGEGWSGGERAESPGDENVVSFSPNKARGVTLDGGFLVICRCISILLCV